jgi:BirA family biotin operon repressor/biotin-[acetyl-CoA-carboxylase] ligase
MSAAQRTESLLRRLADGRFHSGSRLAEQMGVSRAAVCKQVHRLSAELGIPIDAVRGRGYRLARALELLDRESIHGLLTADAQHRLGCLTLLGTTCSTNAQALAGIPQQSGLAHVWLAEHQTAGRGRRGRPWVSTYGENLYLSLAWRFDLPMAELAGLSLAAGVVVSEALADAGIVGHALKWPNDVTLDGRKLGGILVEAVGESGGPAAAVIGIGINFRLSSDAAGAIDQPWASLEQIVDEPVSRNALAGRLIDRLIRACGLYGRDRLGPFLASWQRYDGLRDRAVRILHGPNAIDGIYRGVADDGAAIIENADGLAAYHAGEVSLRGRAAR